MTSRRPGFDGEAERLGSELDASARDSPLVVSSTDTNHRLSASSAREDVDA